MLNMMKWYVIIFAGNGLVWHKDESHAQTGWRKILKVLFSEIDLAESRFLR
jgi:hypothetical protein